MTSTQSFGSGGVNSRVPLAVKSPIRSADPLLGLNHQHRACVLASVILLMSIAMVVALPLGMFEVGVPSALLTGR